MRRETVNTPTSREGNLIRYVVYLAGYLITAGLGKLLTKKGLLHLWDIILFILIAAMVLLFYAFRFNREQRYFRREFYIPWLGDFGLLVSLTLGLTASRILLMYLQTYHHLPWYGFQLILMRQPSHMLFWFMLLMNGLVLPILQEFLATGFLFNYAFRQDSMTSGVLGLIVSGLLYAVLNFQMTPLLLLINFLYGLLFAWAYLYTQNFWVPLYLAVVNGILLVIMA